MSKLIPLILALSGCSATLAVNSNTQITPENQVNCSATLIKDWSKK